jgi:hypothetical protein
VQIEFQGAVAAILQTPVMLDAPLLSVREGGDEGEEEDGEAHERWAVGCGQLAVVTKV